MRSFWPFKRKQKAALPAPSEAEAETESSSGEQSGELDLDSEEGDDDDGDASGSDSDDDGDEEADSEEIDFSSDDEADDEDSDEEFDSGEVSAFSICSDDEDEDSTEGGSGGVAPVGIVGSALRAAVSPQQASLTPCDLDRLVITETNEVFVFNDGEARKTQTSRDFRIVPGKPRAQLSSSLSKKNRNGDSLEFGPASEIAMTAPRRMDPLTNTTTVALRSSPGYCYQENDHPYVSVTFSNQTTPHRFREEVNIPLLQEFASWEKVAKFKGKGLALKPLWTLHKAVPRVYQIVAETCGKNRTDGRPAVTALDCELHIYPSDVFRIEITNGATHQLSFDSESGESTTTPLESLQPGFRVLRNGKVLREADGGSEDLEKGGDSLEQKLFGNLQQAYKLIHLFSQIARTPMNFGSGMPGFYFRSNFSVLKGGARFTCYWREMDDHRVAFVREVAISMLLYEVEVALCFGIRVAAAVTLFEACIEGSVGGSARAEGEYATEAVVGTPGPQKVKPTIQVRGDACVAKLKLRLMAGAGTMQITSAICTGLGWEGVWKDEPEIGGYLDCGLWFKGVWIELTCKAGPVKEKKRKVMLARERMDQAWYTRIPGRYQTKDERETFQQLKKDKEEIQRLIQQRDASIELETKAVRAAHRKIRFKRDEGWISQELYKQQKRELRSQLVVLADERRALQGDQSRLTEINNQLDCLAARKLTLKTKAKQEAALRRKQPRLDELKAKVRACKQAIIDLEEHEIEFRDLCDEVHAEELANNSGKVTRTLHQVRLDAKETVLLVRRKLSDEALDAARKNRDNQQQEVDEIRNKIAELEDLLARTPCESPDGETSDAWSDDDGSEEDDDSDGDQEEGEEGEEGEEEEGDDGNDDGGDRDEDEDHHEDADEDVEEDDDEDEEEDEEEEVPSPPPAVTWPPYIPPAPVVVNDPTPPIPGVPEVPVTLPSQDPAGSPGHRHQSSRRGHHHRHHHRGIEQLWMNPPPPPPMAFAGGQNIYVNGTLVYWEEHWVPTINPYW